MSFNAYEDPASEREIFKEKSSLKYQIEQTPQTKEVVADIYESNAKLIDKQPEKYIDIASA